MQNTDPHMQIARKIRSIETAKIEMIQVISDMYRALQTGSERDLAHTLGTLIATAYFVGKQMGLSLDVIDREVLSGLPKTLAQDAVDVADFEFIQRYLAGKR